MKLSRTILCLLLACLLAFLAACAPSTAAPATTSAPADMPIEPEKPGAAVESGAPEEPSKPGDSAAPVDNGFEPFRIALFMQSHPKQNLVQERFDQFNSALENGILRARLEPIYVNGQSYETFLSTAADADICAIPISGYFNIRAQGEFADITEQVRERDNLYGATTEQAWDSVRIDGKIYGFPHIRSTAYNGSVESSILIREDILEALGRPMPETLEELMDTSLAAREAGLDYRIGYWIQQPPYSLHRTYSQWPFYVTDDNLLLFHTDGTVESYPESDIFTQDLDTISLFMAEKLLYLFMDTDISSYQEKWNTLASFSVIFPSDTSEHAKHVSPMQFEPEKVNFRMEPLVPGVVCISPRTDVERALDVIEILYTNQDIYTNLILGREGVDWDIANGDVKYVGETIILSEYRHAPIDRFRILYGDTFAAIPGAEGTVISFPAASSFSFIRPALYDSLFNGYAGLYGTNGIINIRAQIAPASSLSFSIGRLKENGLDIYVQEAQRQYTEFLKSME